MGFRNRSSGFGLFRFFGLLRLGFRDRGSGFGLLGFRVWGLETRARVLGFRLFRFVELWGLVVWGLGTEVWGLGIGVRVWGFRV